MTVIVTNRSKIFARLVLIEIVAIALVFALAFYSGWRDVGIDRENYLEMYKGILSTEDIAEKFFFAKDATFLLLSSLASYFSEDAKLTFFLVCLLSVTAKYLAVKKIAQRHLLSFLVLYAVFLSPGLEFAAMRGGLAIGFLMLALVYNNRRFLFIVFSLLTVASHMALLPAVLLAYRPVNELLVGHKIGYVAIAAMTSLAAASLIALLPHGADYQENPGTLFAYALPTATLIISQLVFYRFEENSRTQRTDYISQFLKILRPVIYGLIAIAFGISSAIVTASTRYLEVVWCLLLLSGLLLYRRSRINMVGLVALIGFLSYLNIYRLTWLAIIDPTT